MKLRLELMATAAALTFVVGPSSATEAANAAPAPSSTSSASPEGKSSHFSEQVFHVGEDAWVSVVKPVSYYGRVRLNPGDQCFIPRESSLVVNETGIFAGGGSNEVDCPYGVQLNLSQQAVDQQNTKYLAFEKRKEEVTEQLRTMKRVKGKSVYVKQNTGDEVTVVNNSQRPVDRVVQRFAGSTYFLQYGDQCHADGTITPVGKLPAGETVMEIKNPKQLGNNCPTGVLFLKPATRINSAQNTTASRGT